MAAQLYRYSLEHGTSEQLFWDTLERLSFLHKRRGEYEEAIQLWQKAARQGHIHAHVEIAKVYEHHWNEPDKALEWTEQAIKQTQASGFSVIERASWLEELERRRQRLQRKVTSR
jgi:TPR repeat protein